MHPQPPQVRLRSPHRSRRRHRPGHRRAGDAEVGQLVRDHGGELLRGADAQVRRDDAGQQPGQRGVVEPGRQYVLPPLADRPVQRGPALEPGPVPGRVLGGDEHHHRARLLAVDGRQFLGQVLTPQPGLLIGVVEAAHTPRLQRRGDLADVIPLGAGE